ncbi:S8 family serine peptidase [Lacticaseibacillus paracasei]|uniref:S8 family serine peptidase n=1 Tax=Lacticaseibacillus paracasei TaxID=1597 RepID=UPI0021C49556|nr:Fn3-like domain-containing protein [Lacticaseibacillus paracasei]MCP9311027.1 S8 family serine peptidase [Lacticaseibacillus paracasei]MCP9347800.1 S8 family serine peptidase [Lacticaseibacillus paracasei]MCP9367427.1 S8 family serine peptidase [Lacticaseibacillus paracasei]MCP9379665.1 S8 family serine peptidase [Lacticaseibacillus paracasei]
MNRVKPFSQEKRRYKMYKSGRHWVYSAIVTFGAASFLMMQPAQGVSADAAAPPPTTQTKSNQAAPDAASADSPVSKPASATTGQVTSSADTPTTTAASATPTATAKSATPAPVASQAKPEASAKAKQPTQPTSVTPSTPTTTNTKTAQKTVSQPAQKAPAAPAKPAPIAKPAPTSNPENKASLTKGNVQPLWDQNIKGQGMVAAVIDQGVEPHQDFRLSDAKTAALSEDQIKAFTASHGYGDYVNEKIPFFYDYTNNVNENLKFDTSNHGQHLAGIIAANGQPSDSKKYVTGIAPEAQLLSMKILGKSSSDSLNNAARAIYDAVDLGANAINISFGMGVDIDDPTAEGQAAIKFATDHGVFVTVATGNNGHAGGIYDKSASNGITTSYQPANASTLTTPSATPSAMAVAAGNDVLDAKAALISPSSWGPTTSYKLKPDITAPGEKVASTLLNDELGKVSGTSQANAYVTGASLLVMQNLKRSTNLTGAQLVKAVKLALMNAANPILDINYPGQIISPRRQGAGQIDVAKAANLTVSAEGTDDAGSVSLQQFTGSKSFVITLENRGTDQQTYTLDLGQPATEVIDTANNKTVHDRTLPGATLTTATPTFTLDAGASKKITFTLSLDDTVKLNQVVEGFIKFKAADDRQSISVPYMGYYGSTNDEAVFDKPANEEGSIFKGGYLVDNNHNPLGITDPTSLSELVNNPTNGFTWQTIGAKIENNKVAFSPNGDGISDTITPYVFTKQNLKQVIAQILDQDNKVMRVIDQETDTTKSFLEVGSTTNADLAKSISMFLNPDKLKWDGQVYDQTTGQMVPAKDGIYTYRLIGMTYTPGENNMQTMSLPVAVDTIKPTLSNLAYSDGKLTADYSDQGVGFTAYSQAKLTIGSATYGIPLNHDNKATSGTINYQLNDDQLANLKTGEGKVTLTITDAAGNSDQGSIKAVVGENKTIESNFIWPQVRWSMPDTKGNLTRSDGRYQALTKDSTFTAQAMVPKGQDYIVTATDYVSDRQYIGTLDKATGIVTFNIDATGQPYANLTISAFARDDFGEFIKSPKTEDFIIFIKKNTAAYSNAKTQTKPFADEATAIKGAKFFSGAAHLTGRSPLTSTKGKMINGIAFLDLNNNKRTLVGIDSASTFYDAKLKTLTLRGKVSDPKNSKLRIFVTPRQNDPQNEVTFAADGSFSMTMPCNPTEERNIGYVLTTLDKDGKEKTNGGFLLLYTDTTLPTLELSDADSMKIDDDGTYLVTTDADTFSIKGSVTDNIGGYRLYSNGNNIFTQQNLAGFNAHQSSAAPNQLTNGYNPYGAASFDETYQLTDGLNIITLQAVDQVGNTVTKTFNVTKTPKLLKEESLDELEITPEQQDQTPKNDAGEAPVTTPATEETLVTPSTESTMVNPEDSKVETSDPIVETAPSKEAQSDGNGATETNTTASFTTGVDENPVDSSANAATPMPNHVKDANTDAEVTEVTNTKDNTQGTTAPTSTDPATDKESTTKSEIDPAATSPNDSKVVEAVTKEAAVNDDKGNQADDGEPTVTNLATSKDSAVQPEVDPASGLQSDDKVVETAVEDDEMVEKEGHKSDNAKPAITDPTTDKDKAVQSEVNPTASSQGATKAVEAAAKDTKVEDDKGNKTASVETGVATPAMDNNSSVKSAVDPTATAPSDNTAPAIETAAENFNIENDKGNETNAVETVVTDPATNKEGTVKSEIEPVATTPSNTTVTATEMTKENTPAEDEKDNQVNAVTDPKTTKDSADKSEIEPVATAATDKDRTVKSDPTEAASTPSEDSIRKTTAEDAKAKDDREAAANAVAADSKADKNNPVESKIDATAITPSNSQPTETDTENAAVENGKDQKSADTPSPVIDPAVDKDRAVKSKVNPATTAPNDDKAPEVTTESSKIENVKSHQSDVVETSGSDSQTSKDPVAESKRNPTATSSSDDTTTETETLATGGEQNSQVDTPKKAMTTTPNDKNVSLATVAPDKTKGDTAGARTVTTTDGQSKPTKTEVGSSNVASNHPSTTDSSTETTSQSDEPTSSNETTEPATTAPSTEDKPVRTTADQKVTDQKSNKDDQANPTAIKKKLKSKVTEDGENISQTNQKDPKTKTAKGEQTTSPLDQKRSALKQKESKEIAPEKSVHATKTAAKTLPPMGMQNSHWLQALGIALLGMILALGIGLTSKKKHEKS